MQNPSGFLLSWLDLSWLDIELTCPKLTYLDLQCWVDQSWIDQSWLALHTQSRHHLGISRHPADTIQQPSWYNSDTLRTPSSLPQDTLRTTFKHPPNFKHVGSFPLIETRCGLFLLVTGENKVNSYSNQLKLSRVCNFGAEFDNRQIK